jgi:hypothetical protein
MCPTSHSDGPNYYSTHTNQERNQIQYISLENIHKQGRMCKQCCCDQRYRDSLSIDESFSIDLLSVLSFSCKDYWFL